MPSKNEHGGRPAKGEPVLDRAFRILDVFSVEHTTMTLSHLSRSAHVPLSSTLRLAMKLVSLGALERNPDGTFSMGIKMLEYAALAPRGHGIRALVLPYMEDLHRATRQHVQLAVREGEQAVIVERLSAPNAGAVLYHAGSRVPLHGTGLGLALLAQTDRDFQERYLSGDLRLEPEGIRVSSAELEEKLAQIRDTGVAHFSRTLPRPADTVAAPLFDATGTCVAAISVLGAGGTLDPRMIDPAILAISRAVSRELSRSARPLRGVLGFQ